MICSVNPDHIVILRNVAALFILCAFFSILTGKTYCKRTVTRFEEPGSFWGIVFIYFLLGTLILLGTYICR